MEAITKSIIHDLFHDKTHWWKPVAPAFLATLVFTALAAFSALSAFVFSAFLGAIAIFTVVRVLDGAVPLEPAESGIKGQWGSSHEPLERRDLR